MAGSSCRFVSLDRCRPQSGICWDFLAAAAGPWSWGHCAPPETALDGLDGLPGATATATCWGMGTDRSVCALPKHPGLSARAVLGVLARAVGRVCGSIDNRRLRPVPKKLPRQVG